MAVAARCLVIAFATAALAGCGSAPMSGSSGSRASGGAVQCYSIFRDTPSQAPTTFGGPDCPAGFSPFLQHRSSN